MPLDLHFSESMEGLIKKSEYVLPSSTPYMKCLDLMAKVHKESLRTKKIGDEEKEFFFLHRYMNLSAYLAKNQTNENHTPVYLKKKKEEYARAKDNFLRYAELRERLQARYEAREKATKGKPVGHPAELNSNEISEKTNKEIQSAPSLSVATKQGFIECNRLYSLITNRTRKELLLIFDVRSAKDFKQSHIDYDQLLNIPEEIITSGSSADNLGKKLTGPEADLWKKRGDADILVLMDWSTSMNSTQTSSKVFVLKKIIRQWDPLTNYKSSPLILEGGYEEVIERYPLITTNPKVQIPRSPSITSTDALSNLEYPLEDLEPERPKTTPAVPKPQPPPQEVRHSAPSSVDRSTKPATVNSKTRVTDENLNSLIDDLADSFSEESDISRTEVKDDANETEQTQTFEPLPSDSVGPIDSSSDDEPPSSNSVTKERFYGSKRRYVFEEAKNPLNIFNIKKPRRHNYHWPSTSDNRMYQIAVTGSRKPDPALVDNLRKLKPSLNNSAPRSEGSGPSMDGDRPQNLIKPRSATSNLGNDGISHEPLKKDGSSSGILRRSSSSPNIKEMSDDEPLTHYIPSFSRANKPSTPKVQHYLYNERADSIHGNTSPGLTGLKNFANNCYMNSILQCLNNTEPLVNELLALQSYSSDNMGSRLKGRIAQEVIAAFRSMWSGEIKVYSIRELKSLMGDIKDIFKGSMHQDSNEFLIILLEHLHEDLNVPAEVGSLTGAVEETGEKAWGEFRRKNCSIIQQLFYGQHRSTVTCSTCGHYSATFEQFFNLFVPIPPGQYSVSLTECIQLYMSGERINGWICPSCKVERNATKKFDISRLPPVLIIALKRFTQEDGSWLHKKENLVSYPLSNLDMTRFTVPNSEQRYKVYDLYAMSTHSGTLQSGHYRAICKNAWNKKWYMFDDQSVEQLTESSVASNPEVYILFYIAKQNS